MPFNIIIIAWGVILFVKKKPTTKQIVTAQFNCVRRKEWDNLRQKEKSNEITEEKCKKQENEEKNIKQHSHIEVDLTWTIDGWILFRLKVDTRLCAHIL